MTDEDIQALEQEIGASDSGLVFLEDDEARELVTELKRLREIEKAAWKLITDLREGWTGDPIYELDDLEAVLTGTDKQPCGQGE